MAYRYDQLQSDFAQLVQEHYKPKPQSWKFARGPGSLQDKAARTALAAYRSAVKDHRAYAVSRERALEFAALATAAVKAGRNPAEVMRKLANIIALTIQEYREVPARKKATTPVPDICPPWQKEMPAEDAGTVPALPIDPCTGQRVRNPFEKPLDGRSAHLIEELSPRLSVWLRDCAKFGGPTMAMLDALAAEKIAADHERKIVEAYDEKMWEANLLRADSGATLTQQGEFVNSIEDLTLRKIHEREAKAGSPTMGFDNLSVRMAIAKRDPALREIHAEAHEISKGWQEAEKAA